MHREFVRRDSEGRVIEKRITTRESLGEGWIQTAGPEIDAAREKKPASKGKRRRG